MSDLHFKVKSPTVRKNRSRMWSPNLAHLIPVAERMDGRPGANPCQPCSRCRVRLRRSRVGRWHAGYEYPQTKRRPWRGAAPIPPPPRHSREILPRTPGRGESGSCPRDGSLHGHMLSLIEFRLCGSPLTITGASHGLSSLAHPSEKTDRSFRASACPSPLTCYLSGLVLCRSHDSYRGPANTLHARDESC